MKGGILIVVVLCTIVLGVSLVSGQTCSGANADDFYIMNVNGVGLRIDATNDHVHVCGDIDLCNFIKEESSENEKQAFTETSGNSAYKSVPGSLYIGGTANTGDTTFDGLASEITTPQTFLWYGSKAAFRAGQFKTLTPATVGLESSAFGFNTLASAPEAFASGDSTTASAISSTALGRLGVASGNASFVANGDVQTAQQGSATQIKPDFTPRNPGNPDNKVPSESGPQASGVGSTAFGLSTISNNTAATAFGFASVASGPGSTTWGVQNQAEGLSSTAWGFRSFGEGDFSTAWGVECQAVYSRSTAWGFESIAYFPDSTAAGNSAESRGGQAFAFGNYVQVSAQAATVVGSCNYEQPGYANGDYTNEVGGKFPATYPGRQALSTDYVFQIGNGPSNEAGCQSYHGNAVTVLKNGDLYVAGNIYYGIGQTPYAIPKTQKCRCLSADGSCDINSLAGNQCTPDDPSIENTDSATFTSPNRRDVEEQMESMRNEIESLKDQVKMLSKLIKA